LPSEPLLKVTRASFVDPILIGFWCLSFATVIRRAMEAANFKGHVELLILVSNARYANKSEINYRRRE
jgi:hypothetical protein